MIYHPNALATTEKLREIPQETVEDFPHIAIESDLELYAGRCASWHWHDYFEFALVSGGDMELSTQRQSMRIRPGEGYFINSNVMHMCRVADGSGRARLQVHQFDRSLIAPCGALARKYVQPVEGRSALDALHLRPENPVHKRILAEIEAAHREAGAEGEGYELSILHHLLGAWQALHQCVQPAPEEGQGISPADSSRIKLMLACIHTRYSENLSVPMIAQAASICSREAFRCFRQVLGTTPTLYLMRHRVNAAARMLIETGSTITDIAFACGFSSPGYFCKVFRDIIGRSPREFRKMTGDQK